MKWTNKLKNCPPPRTVRKFIWWPTKLISLDVLYHKSRPVREWRWLEWAYIVQTSLVKREYIFGLGWYIRWANESWAAKSYKKDPTV